eukprot:397837-Rhodomonas_salina.2
MRACTPKLLAAGSGSSAAERNACGGSAAAQGRASSGKVPSSQRSTVCVSLRASRQHVVSVVNVGGSLCVPRAVWQSPPGDEVVGSSGPVARKGTFLSRDSKCGRRSVTGQLGSDGGGIGVPSRRAPPAYGQSSWRAQARLAPVPCRVRYHASSYIDSMVRRSPHGSIAFTEMAHPLTFAQKQRPFAVYCRAPTRRAASGACRGCAYRPPFTSRNMMLARRASGVDAEKAASSPLQ